MVTKSNQKTAKQHLKTTQQKQHLKQHYSTVRSTKNVAVLTEDGPFALFFFPHPGGFESSRVPIPGNLTSKAKKNTNARGSAPGGERGGLGAAGID